MAVPKDAYELNFVFSDAEGAFDNNSNQNYCKSVEGPMTHAIWIDTAAERAVSAFRSQLSEALHSSSSVSFPSYLTILL